MSRRFRPAFETLERREVFSANPLMPFAGDGFGLNYTSSNEPAMESAILPYIEQDNIYKQGRTQGIIAILIG